MASLLLRLLYSSRLFAPLRWILVRGWLNRLARWWFTARISRWHIRRFIKKHSIDATEFAEPISSYRTFDDFFIRRLTKESRPLDKHPHSIVSPADGQVFFVPELTDGVTFHVKKHQFSLRTFLDNEALVSRYTGGSMLIVRLAPHDYHRFHMPVAGSVTDHGSIGGRYETVQPIGYDQQVPLLTNHRHIFEITTATKQHLLLVAVGGLCVGTIETTYNRQTNYFLKGSELGYFGFGGSTIALLAPQDSINIRTDILTASSDHHETPVRMGSAVSQWRMHTHHTTTPAPSSFPERSA